MLEIVQKPLAFGDFSQKGSGLGNEKVLVISDQDGTLRFEHLSLATVHPDSGQSLLIERLKLPERNRQQIGMLGGNQRADKVIGAFFDRLQIVPAVVAFIEDDGDVLSFVRDLAVPADKLLGEAEKDRSIGLVARVGTMKQRNMKVRRHQQGQADDPQRPAALFTLAPLGNRATLVEGVNEGEEIGTVEKHPFEIDVEVAHHLDGDIPLDRFNGLAGEAVHIFPKSLARKLPLVNIHETAQDRSLEPPGDAGLAAGRNAAVEDTNQKVVANAGSRPLFGRVAIDILTEVQPLQGDYVQGKELVGQVIQGRHSAKLDNDSLPGFGQCFGRLGRLCHGPNDILRTPQVLLPNDLGFSFDPFALPGVVVGFAADHFFSDARHIVGHT